MTTETLNHLPAGWIVLDVMRRAPRSREWTALVVDDYPQAGRKGREGWLHIPGKHSNRDAAWDALEDMTATRH